MLRQGEGWRASSTPRVSRTGGICSPVACPRSGPGRRGSRTSSWAPSSGRSCAGGGGPTARLAQPPSSGWTSMRLCTAGSGPRLGAGGGGDPATSTSSRAAWHETGWRGSPPARGLSASWASATARWRCAPWQRVGAPREPYGHSCSRPPLCSSGRGSTWPGSSSSRGSTCLTTRRGTRPCAPRCARRRLGPATRRCSGASRRSRSCL
eukprot:4272746-Lingulodinium_polyedra.AAC.1